MLEVVALRVLATLAWVLAAGALARTAQVAISTGDGPGTGPAALVARASACFVLAYLGWLAWRSTSPARRAGRARRRVLRVLAALSNAELQHDWLEAAPLVPLAESLARDWRHALRPGDAAFERAFSAEEHATLRAFDAEAVELLRGLPAGRDARDDVGRLDDPAWRALRSSAAAARGQLPA